jgi:hypothetical protein
MHVAGYGTGNHIRNYNISEELNVYDMLSTKRIGFII